MRVSVVVIASVLAVVAGTLLRDRPEPETRPPAPADVVRPADPRSSPVLATPTGTLTYPRIANTPGRVAPVNRFLSGGDLWEAYQSLRRGTNGGDLWVAEHILGDCFFSTRSGAAVAQVLAGNGVVVFDAIAPTDVQAVATGRVIVKSHREAASPDQLAAAQELGARCGRFASLSATEYHAQANDVKGRRQHADDPVALAEAIREHRMRDTDENLRIVLGSQDPVAFDQIGDVLADRLLHRLGRPTTDDDMAALAQAIQLVQCDLGNDCSVTSEPALLACVMWTVNCRLDLQAQKMSHESPFVQQRIEELRRLMVHAITGGDYAIWGL